MSKPSIPYVVLRNNRPRFVPSPELRKLGHKGHDLKHEDGTWFSAGEALDWSNAFLARHQLDKSAARKKKATSRTIAPAAALAEIYSVAQMMADWLGSVRVLARSANTIRDYRQKTRVLENFFLKVKAWEAFDHKTAEEDTEIPPRPDKTDRAIALVWVSDAAALDRPICYNLYEQLFRKSKIHTANAVMTCLGMAIEYAQKKGKLPELRNPAHKLGKETPKIKIRWAEPEEVEALIAAADRLGRPEIGDMISLGVWIGQRQGDRLHLHLGQLKNGRFDIDQSKTGAQVSIPLAPALRARLQAATARRVHAVLERAEKGEKMPQNVVLDEADGRLGRSWVPFKADWYRHLFVEARDEAAKTVPSVTRIRDKDLRATAVMWLAQASCTNTQIAAITGHTLKTVDTILKHYWAASAAQADDAMAKMVAWHLKQGRTE